ncbi:hypothetical protein B566_EDAN008015 [Ephemera danica]|nr:hypothetical protein B566_EDAN008015 [Ephemera danica]
MTASMCLTSRRCTLSTSARSARPLDTTADAFSETKSKHAAVVARAGKQFYVGGSSIDEIEDQRLTILLLMSF